MIQGIKTNALSTFYQNGPHKHELLRSKFNPHIQNYVDRSSSHSVKVKPQPQNRNAVRVSQHRHHTKKLHHQGLGINTATFTHAHRQPRLACTRRGDSPWSAGIQRWSHRPRFISTMPKWLPLLRSSGACIHRQRLRSFLHSMTCPCNRI